MSDISVSDLLIYPVKSCREIIMSSTQVEAFGLQDDRRWMVVDKNGRMLTQRKFARMCLIQPELIQNGLILKLFNESDKTDLFVEIPSTNIKNRINIRVKIWNNFCQAVDAGNDAAYWLSDVLKTECRLVYFPDDGFRQVDLAYAKKGDETAFSDGFPLLLISQASLDDLNKRLTTPIKMNRFRPNIVVQGCEAFAEDQWKQIRIGEVVYRIVKPCSRCVIPSINTETAEKEEEPLKTLMTYRKRDNKIFFGQNVIANSSGKIEVGMQVEIID